MKKQRRTFSPEFKLEAANLVLNQSYSITEASRSYDNQASSKGKIKEWNNESGHYKPSAIDAKKSGLPLNKFKKDTVKNGQ